MSATFKDRTVLKTHRRHQRPVKGGRESVGAGVLQQVDARIRRTALRYNVSRSFVIATILATYYNIDTEPLQGADPRSATGRTGTHDVVKPNGRMRL